MALDMDGTVLNEELEISEKNQAAINQAVELGMIVVIATGRAYHSLRQYQEILQLTHPFITYNGGVVISPNGEEIFYQQNVPEEAALEIIRCGQAFDVSQCVWSNDKPLYYQINQTHASRCRRERHYFYPAR